jgi:hypothetical protein
MGSIPSLVRTLPHGRWAATNYKGNVMKRVIEYFLNHENEFLECFIAAIGILGMVLFISGKFG